MELVSVLEGVQMMTFVVMEETSKCVKNHQPKAGDKYPATHLFMESNLGCSGEKQVFNHNAILATLHTGALVCF